MQQVGVIRSVVPHASFRMSFPDDPECPHPKGLFLAKRLQEALSSITDKVEWDNWRDVGWALDITLNGHEFEIYFASKDSLDWLLAIADSSPRSILSKIFGRKRLNVEPDLRTLALIVQDALSNLGVSNLYWQFGGPPLDEASGVKRPEDLDWQLQHNAI